MKDDSAGLVVMHALLDAADLGVRVRFLLDDVFTTTPDQKLLAFNQHPNIEIRLFSPVSRHGVDSLNFLLNFERANRRMHNKSFTVDNAISVVGDRNIAEEYFQLKEDAVFSDFNMLAFGAIAKDIVTSFDDYWNHSSAIPIEQLASADKGYSHYKAHNPCNQQPLNRRRYRPSPPKSSPFRRQLPPTHRLSTSFSTILGLNPIESPPLLRRRSNRDKSIPGFIRRVGPAAVRHGPGEAELSRRRAPLVRFGHLAAVPSCLNQPFYLSQKSP